MASSLKKQGYTILELNWRTKWCEVDIVARRDRSVYFIEVKYRSGQMQGDGLSYIANQKLQKLRFAVELWRVSHNWEGDVSLLAVSVTGETGKLRIDSIVEIG